MVAYLCTKVERHEAKIADAHHHQNLEQLDDNLAPGGVHRHIQHGVNKVKHVCLWLSTILSWYALLPRRWVLLNKC